MATRGRVPFVPECWCNTHDDPCRTQRGTLWSDRFRPCTWIKPSHPSAQPLLSTHLHSPSSFRSTAGKLNGAAASLSSWIGQRIKGGFCATTPDHQRSEDVPTQTVARPSRVLATDSQSHVQEEHSGLIGDATAGLLAQRHGLETTVSYPQSWLR